MNRRKLKTKTVQRTASVMLAICLSLALVACGNSKDSSTQTEAQTPEQPQSQTSAETAGAEQTIVENQKETNDSKVLVAYFAFSENIGDTNSMDVDAITSASLNRHTANTEGNLQIMAQAAVEAAGGDLFSIVVTEPYNPEYNSMAGAAQEDQRNGKVFAFVNEIENLEQYDTVYIGVPVWWGKLPQPMVSFFENYDFSGKTIIPFGIHLGSRFGSMIKEMRELEPDAEVLDGFTISADTDNEKVLKEFREYLGTLE